MEESGANFTANISHEIPGGFNWKRWLIISGFFLVGLIIYTYISSPMVVTVTGVGEVTVPATNATISFTISDSDPNAADYAISKVESKAATIRNYLKSKGIAEADISESQVTAVPAGFVTSGVTGYQASIAMGIKTVHVSSASDLVSALYSQGALVVTQPVLSVENESNLENQALDAAVKDADSQAKRIGLLRWKFIRKLVNLSQVSSPTTSTSTSKADAAIASNDQAAISNGVFKVVKAVSATYAIW